MNEMNKGGPGSGRRRGQVSVNTPGKHVGDNWYPVGHPKGPTAAKRQKRKDRQLQRQATVNTPGKHVGDNWYPVGHSKGPKKVNKAMSLDEDNDLTKSLGNLFKAEIGDDDKYLIDCPHCDEPIMKSEVLAKAKGKGSKALAALPKGKKTDKVLAQNNASGPGANSRGKVGKNIFTQRPPKKVPKTDPAYPGQYATFKSEGVDDSSEEEVQDDMLNENTSENTSEIRGTPYVQYVTDGTVTGDAAIAKAIAEGRIGQAPSQPIDKNHRNF